MSKQTFTAVDGVDYRYQFLFQTGFDEFPKLNPRHFAVLALIDGGYSQNQIIKELTDMKLAKFRQAGEDREFQITFEGARYLDSYAAIMSIMLRK